MKIYYNKLDSKIMAKWYKAINEWNKENNQTMEARLTVGQTSLEN